MGSELADQSEQKFLPVALALKAHIDEGQNVPLVQGIFLGTLVCVLLHWPRVQ